MHGKEALFIADSESSAIRVIKMETRRAYPVVGANENPEDLFDFGDYDGVGFEAKLQHPQGVAYCQANEIMYIADTYNHKVKLIKLGECGQTTTTSSL